MGGCHGLCGGVRVSGRACPPTHRGLSTKARAAPTASGSGAHSRLSPAGGPVFGESLTDLRKVLLWLPRLPVSPEADLLPPALRPRTSGAEPSTSGPLSSPGRGLRPQTSSATQGGRSHITVCAACAAPPPPPRAASPWGPGPGPQNSNHSTTQGLWGTYSIYWFHSFRVKGGQTREDEAQRRILATGVWCQ